MTDEYEGGYFNAVVKDAIREIKSNGSTIVFSRDQVRAIEIKIPDIEVREDGGFYYIRRIKNDKRSSVQS